MRALLINFVVDVKKITSKIENSSNNQQLLRKFQNLKSEFEQLIELCDKEKPTSMTQIVYKHAKKHSKIDYAITTLQLKDEMRSPISSESVERSKKGRKTEVTKFIGKNKRLNTYIEPSSNQKRHHILSPVPHKLTDTSVERMTSKKFKKQTRSRKRKVSKSPAELPCKFYT